MDDAKNKNDLNDIQSDEDGDWESIVEMVVEAVKITIVCSIVISLKSSINILYDMLYLARNQLSDYYLLLVIPVLLLFGLIFYIVNFLSKV